MCVRHGFTLLEVLIALMVLGIGIMAVMQLFPPSLYQARLATERVPTAAWADRELGILRSWGLSIEQDQDLALAWPVDSRLPVFNSWGASYLQYTIEPLGIPDVVRPMASSLGSAAEIYYLYRVTIAVPMVDGRYEKFTTMISRY